LGIIIFRYNWYILIVDNCYILLEGICCLHTIFRMIIGILGILIGDILKFNGNMGMTQMGIEATQLLSSQHPTYPLVICYIAIENGH